MDSKKLDSALLEEISSYSQEYHKANVPDTYVYHSLEHTERVVEAAKEIMKHCEYSQDEQNEIIAAAWFHDLGYAKGPENHEEESCRIMEEFLSLRSIDSESIKRIRGCILATKMGSDPKTELEKVLVDADLFHLATDAYLSQSQNVKKEYQTVFNRKLKKKEWMKMGIEFLSKHKYQTDYGKDVLEKGKLKNLEDTKKALREMEDEKKAPKKEEKVNPKIKPDRGRETMFRITSRNHLELSNMADNKANIMISVNAIMLSLIVSMLIRKLEGDPYLIIPTLILVAVCLTTIIFAIRATRPNISSGKFTREDIRAKRTNLLFFGNFHRVSLDDFDWGMQEMIKDSDYLYSSMIKDIYYLGVILGKKYRNLRIAYTIFMYGFAIAIMSYIVAFVIYGTS